MRTAIAAGFAALVVAALAWVGWQAVTDRLDADEDTPATAIDGLVDQTRAIERAVAALDLGNVSIEGSDSLDNVNAVFQ